MITLDMERKFNRLIRKASRRTPAEGLDMIRRSYEFAAASESRMKTLRWSGEPSMMHYLSVAEILAEWGLDPVIVCAGMLHDLIEDPKIHALQIRATFQDDVAFLVESVTKLKRFELSGDVDADMQYFLKMFRAASSDIRVPIIKLADRRHNMSTLAHLPEQKRWKNCVETRKIFIPLARRLGMTQVKEELEDMCMLHLEPEKFRRIASALTLRRTEETEILHDCRAGLQKAFSGDEWRVRTGIAFFPISAFDDGGEEGGPLEDADRLTGLAQVVCPEDGDCYRALDKVHAAFQYRRGSLLDSVHTAEDDLHRSLTTTVRVGKRRFATVRIVSEEMKLTNELGVAAFLVESRRLKRTDFLEARIREIQSEIGALRREGMRDKAMFYNTLTQDLIAQHISALTPQGDRVRLPAGSTALDFAYKIHSQIGNRFDHAQVNGKRAEAHTKLNHYDLVEVATSETVVPDVSWLKCAATNYARYKIRAALKKAPREATLRSGKTALDATLTQYGFHRAGFYDERGAAAGKALRVLGFKDEESLLMAVGTGALEEGELLKRLKDSYDQWAGGGKESRRQTFARHPSFQTVYPPQIAVSNRPHQNVVRCEACLPLPGEPTAGSMLGGRRLTLHREDCRKLRGLFATGRRKTEAHWTREAMEHSYPVRARVLGFRTPGLQEEIEETLRRGEAKVLESRLEGLPLEEQAQVELVVEVRNLGHARALLEALFKLKNVLKVLRD